MGRKPKNFNQQKNVEIKKEQPEIKKESIDIKKKEVKKELVSETKETETIKEETKISKDICDIPIVECDATQFIEKKEEYHVVDTENFKPVSIFSDNQIAYNNKLSKVIYDLKQNSEYKFLSKIALIKIAKDFIAKGLV